MKFTVERDFSSSIHLYKIQKKYLINVLSSSIFLNFQFKKLASLSSRYITMMEQNRNHVPCETLNEWDCTYFSVWWKIKSNSGERDSSRWNRLGDEVNFTWTSSTNASSCWILIRNRLRTTDVAWYTFKYILPRVNILENGHRILEWTNKLNFSSIVSRTAVLIESSNSSNEFSFMLLWNLLSRSPRLEMNSLMSIFSDNPVNFDRMTGM